MKLLVHRSALEKLLARFKELCASPTERDSTMVRWFEEFLSDDATPGDRVLRQIGKLKQGWERPLSCEEMQELHGSMDALSTLTESEWATIREWLNYKPKSWEKLYQVQNRKSFLRSPVDTLTAAETWKDANKPRDRATRKPVDESAGETLSREDALAILRGEQQ
jgi:hypothetical protein